MKKFFSNSVKVLLPLLISAVVLVYTYRDYDFSKLWYDIERLKLGWIFFAVVFSWLSPLFRGLRWNLILSPLGYKVPYIDSILTVFTGYAANIIIPRFGEISRCAILDRHNSVPFSKGLGTLLAERFVDMVLLMLICGITVLWQFPYFMQLFSGNSTVSADVVSEPASSTLNIPVACYWVLGILAVVVLVWLFVKFKPVNWIRKFISDLWAGFMSLKKVDNLPLFLFYSLGIWVCYYLEMYLAFFSLESTASVGAIAGLVCFVAGSVAVLVPTPNGAGPWHWVVISMLVIYGVPVEDAKPLALVLHTAQTVAYLLGGFVS
ncbi:MAG: flippase-like domain-containing protein, partial [Bacteroidaceae bacterium]|nr:flippase-like domain-containing protein [Bacteroidaceae bacterium]